MRGRVALIVLAAVIAVVTVMRWPAGAGLTSGEAQVGQPTPRSAGIFSPHAPVPVETGGVAPDHSAADASKAYRFRRTCAGVASFTAFLLQQYKNPYSWMNDEGAAATQLTPETIEHLRAGLERRRVHQRECARLGFALDDGSIYAAALRAANAGDTEAAVCYVLARWPQPKDPHFKGPRISHSSQGIEPRYIREYQANARRLIDEGLQRGDWRMVSLLHSAWIERHGQLIGGLKDFSVPDEQYRTLKLMLLGTPPEQAAPVQVQLDFAEQTIPASRIGIANARAKALYARSFSDKGAYAWNLPSCAD